MAMARVLLMPQCMFDRSTRVGDIVLAHTATASVFDRRRIDYCCSGHDALDAACQKRGVAVDTILAELQEAVAVAPMDVDLRTTPTSTLISRVIAHQHRDIRATLALLQYAAANLASTRRGVRIVRQLRAFLDELGDRLLAHMSHEEEHLFPLLLAQPVLEETRTKLGKMFDDHADITRLLRAMRELTDDYGIPIDDNDLRCLYAGLSELDALITRHHHVENHVLLARFR